MRKPRTKTLEKRGRALRTPKLSESRRIRKSPRLPNQFHQMGSVVRTISFPLILLAAVVLFLSNPRLPALSEVYAAIDDLKQLVFRLSDLAIFLLGLVYLIRKNLGDSKPPIKRRKTR